MPRLENPAKRPEVRAKISATLKANWSAELSRRLKARWDAGLMPKPITRTVEMNQRSADRMRADNPMRKPEVVASQIVSIAKSKEANSARMHKSWREGRIKPRSFYGANRVGPNKPEQRLLDLIESLKLPFEYVGNGAFWIGPCATGGRRNPDFIDKVNKRVILLHGRYWHAQEDVRRENYDYLGSGWRPLVVWDDEVKLSNRCKLIAKLRSFATCV